MTRRAALAAIALLVLASTRPAAAQTLRVSALQGVSFGTMLPGVSTVVPRTDGARAAEFDIKGTGGGRVVQLQFTLPAALSGPSGATIPLSYSAGDAGFSAQQSIATQVGFDPRQSYTATLSGNGRASVFLGATANPSTSQTAGSYSATLTLTVAYFP